MLDYTHIITHIGINNIKFTIKLFSLNKLNSCNNLEYNILKELLFFLCLYLLSSQIEYIVLIYDDFY